MLEWLKTLISDPVLALLALLGVVIVTWLHKHAATAMEQLTPAHVAAGFPRVEAMILILHGLAVVSAAAWCYFATDFEPPGIKTTYVPTLPPAVERAFQFGFYGASGTMAWVALMTRGETFLSISLRPVSRAMTFGALTSMAIVAWAANLDPTLLLYSPLRPTGLASIPWWYCMVGLMAPSASLAIALAALAGRLLWRMTAAIP